MSIIRTHTNAWKSVPSAAAEDPRMSNTTRGVLFWLLTRPENWEIRIGAMLRLTNTSETIWQKRVRPELVNAGYLVVTKSRNPTNGYIEWQFDVYSISRISLPSPRSPSLENPGMDNPGVEKPCMESPSLENGGTKDTGTKEKGNKEIEAKDIQGGRVTAQDSAPGTPREAFLQKLKIDSELDSRTALWLADNYLARLENIPRGLYPDQVAQQLGRDVKLALTKFLSRL